jgi:hypothetical protein
VLQAVPENGVDLAPFETLAMPKALTDEVNLMYGATRYIPPPQKKHKTKKGSTKRYCLFQQIFSTTIQ